MSKFKPVSPRVDFVKQEEEILAFWEKEKIFEQSLALRDGAERFVFYEGPPTANGKPGIHHALGRYFKDTFPRFKTMRGYLVDRKGGWDTHGLPVEIAVEKLLGFSGKSDIEKYGIAAFNAKAKESVWEYKDLWEKFTRRLGYWVDLDNPYITYEPNYIESVWWVLKQIWDKGLIYPGHRVSPWCPRCGTVLSSHELAQGYQEDTDTSVYVKFKVKSANQQIGKSANEGAETYILAWTTTPWTLPGNVALAVGENITYAKLKIKNEKLQKEEILILAQDLVEKVFGSEEVEIIEKLTGKDLVGLEYEPLFPGAIPEETENLKNAFKVISADFVTTEDGTGIVHTAVMYGEEDYKLADADPARRLPKVHTVDKEGKFLSSVSKWAGRSVNDSEVTQEIIEDLKARKPASLLFREEKYKHDYPHCWRCDTKLIYYATDSWFIKVSEIRKELIANNETINWIPGHIKEGRFGEWLKDAKDWAISRARYWGTPLPFWVSESGDMICVGSFEELKKLAKNPDLVGEAFDPHRPFVDEIVLEKDGREYRRVPEVLDVWFDSGAMPFAQWHVMSLDDPVLKDQFPADFISEGIDQTRGWFYTLLAISTLLGKEAPYKNVISFGHILDKRGKKMSKSKGNVVDPWEMFEKYGADALRWYLFTINQPGLPKNFDENGVRQVTQRFSLTLWNTYSFFVMYANIDEFDPSQAVAKFNNPLDRWILARRDETIATVTEDLESYDSMAACLAIEAFVNDLSNWYVRRSRRRFWKSEDAADKAEAYSALYTVLMDTVKMMAPLMPFLSEAIYGGLKTESDPASVHLADWPVSPKMIDDSILMEMKKTREIVEAGLNLREQAGIKIRQPLASVTVVQPEMEDGLVEILREELNVKEVKLGGSGVDLDTDLSPALVAEGNAREIVRAIQIMRKDQGFEVTDRIRVTWESADNAIVQAFDSFGEYIQTEVLATEISQEKTEGSAPTKINQSVVELKITK